MEYMSSKEAAIKWGISTRRVTILCNENRIDGVVRMGKFFLIPKSANKPEDARTVLYKQKSERILS